MADRRKKVRIRSRKPLIEALEERCVPSSSSWNNFGGNPQHTGVSAVEAQPMNGVIWKISIDTQPWGAEHYGEPVFTPADTVIVPVKTGWTANYVMEGVNHSDGSVIWSASSDYTQPPNYDWLPPFQAVYDPVNDRAYFTGNGGTIYYISHPDNPGSSNPTPTQVAFYGISNYNSNPSAYNSSIYIDSPLTVDSSGNLFFGFTETGTNPSGITQGGIARIGADGTGTYVLAGTAAGSGSNVDEAALGSAPALSNDGTILYAALNQISNSNNGYLVGLNSTTLAPMDSVQLLDPASGNAAGVIVESTAGPMVAPDGTVFLGVFGSPYNGSRGFLLHFSGNLSTEYTSGAFGWDDTPSIIPTSMVPSYQGTSKYLILSKYNNYVAAEVGAYLGGNGLNQIAILDPYSSQLDPNYDYNPNLQVMKQVLTLPSPTPDTQYTGSGFLDAVREWCTNGTAVDPASDSVFINNEDGYAYRWNLSNNTITQAVEITDGIGEPYTPTAIGPDGTIYAINGGTLFALGGYANYSEAFTASPNPAVVGQSITFTATLTPTNGGATPTGSVKFSYTVGANDPMNSMPIVLATVSLVNGVASYSTSTLGAGHYHVVAAYSGDSNYGAGNSTLVQVILDNANVTLTSSNNPAQAGSTVTFTATITPATLQVVPLGTITFMDGPTVLGTVQLSNQDGTNYSTSTTATFATSTLPVGVHQITAVYSGDQNLNQATSAALGQTIYKTLISGRVFNDLNGSGVDNTSDPGLSGWTIEALNPGNGQVVESQVTDSNGNYEFLDLPAGTYTIEEVAQSGWQQTYPVPPGSYSITVATGQVTQGNDFGNFQLESFSGLVYDDINDTHVYQSGDPVLSNVPIFVDGTQVGSTDNNGNYTVTLGPGTHTVSEAIPTAYIAIAPASGSQSVTANQSGGSITGINFADALPTGTLDDGQSGYVNVPGGSWSNLSLGWNGESRLHAAMTNAKLYASWTVNANGHSVPPGTYEVFVSYASSPNRSQVYYKLYDGVQDNVHLLGTVTVNQALPPDVSGNANGTYQGVTWLSLGKYAIDNSQLIVVMTCASFGKKTMDADGVLFIPAGSTAPQVLTGTAAAITSTSKTQQPTNNDAVDSAGLDFIVSQLRQGTQTGNAVQNSNTFVPGPLKVARIVIPTQGASVATESGAGVSESLISVGKETKTSISALTDVLGSPLDKSAIDSLFGS
jgi:hypothetical protein